MPVLIDGTVLSSPPKSVDELLHLHPHLKESAAQLCGQELRSVGPEGLLYVNQREYAVIPTDDSSGVTALAHLDGCDTEEGMKRMMNDLKRLSEGTSAGRIELHMAGGFIDKREESIKLTKDLFRVLISLEDEIHLMVACITDLNDELRDGIHFPVIYGLGVDIKTGEVFRAKFPDQGPDMNVRSACHFGGCHTLMNIYRTEDNTLTIGPYSWEPWYEVEAWLNVPDHFIRRHLSTSPEQEPPYFVSHVREALKVLRDHPHPHETLFPDNEPFLYTKHSNGSWIRKT